MGLAVTESVQMGVPMLPAIVNKIFLCQYSLDNPKILTHTWAEVLCCILGLKSFDQAKNLRRPGLRFHDGMDLTLRTSSRDEKVNSK
jgi:hypothetical protein